MIPPFVTSRATAPRQTDEPGATGGEIVYHPSNTSDAVPAGVSVPDAADTEREIFLDSLGGMEVDEDEFWGGEVVDAPLIPTAEADSSEPFAPAAELPGWLDDGAAQTEAEESIAELAAPEAVLEPGYAAPDPVIDEVASRLEEIARSLRSKSPAELLSGARAGAAEPLELLITGFVLGYSQNTRRAADTDLH